MPSTSSPHQTASALLKYRVNNSATCLPHVPWDLEFDCISFACWIKMVKVQLKHFDYQMQVSGFEYGVLPVLHGKE